MKNRTTCAHDGCTNWSNAKGLCSVHYIDATQRPCCIDGCPNTRIIAKGMCTVHYKRWYRLGDPLAEVNSPTPKGSTDKERLEFRGWTVTDAGCWEWNGLCDDKGYGRLWTGKRVEFAHRVMYRVRHGELADSSDMMHQCDNPPCINPDHLRPGDDYLNTQEKVERGRTLNGELSPWHRITDEQVQAIRDEYTGAWGQQTVLAEKYGVAPSYVSVLVRGLARSKPTNWRPGYEQPWSAA